MSGPAHAPADPAAFRRFMGRWATGVTIVTVRDGGTDHGLTANAFLSVSLAPPTVLLSVGREADSAPALERAGTFAVNLLAFDQQELSERFGRSVPPAEKFAGLAPERGRTGAALLGGTLGSLEARVVRIEDAGDHRLVLGEVLEVRSGREVPPLLFFRSQYARPDADSWQVRLEPPPGRPKT